MLRTNDNINVFNSEQVAGKRIFLFAGHYGSGKSEVAVNFAMGLSRLYSTAIVDFDIVNTFFRAAGARNELERGGIRVVAPVYANTNVDVPALPAEISGLFGDSAVKAVFDVGGDGAGAKAVSRYRDDFAKEDYANFFVFNIRRPMTSTLRQITEYFYEIQGSARLPFTAIINNTNLLGETGAQDLLEGLDTAGELSRRLSLPVAFSAYMFGAGGEKPYMPGEFAMRAAEMRIPIFIMKKYIHM